MSPISILLMMIVDTVAQVAAKGQWTPYFDILGTSADLYFRPADFDRSKPDASSQQPDRRVARIIPSAFDDAQSPVEELQRMLTFARRHLDVQPEA